MPEGGVATICAGESILYCENLSTPTMRRKNAKIVSHTLDKEHHERYFYVPYGDRETTFSICIMKILSLGSIPLIAGGLGIGYSGGICRLVCFQAFLLSSV